MADNDLDALARRYYELWQSQLSALASDRELSGSVARLLAAANAQIGAAFGGRDEFTRPVAAGAAATAAAPGDGAADLGELRERVALLEGRIAKLERRAARTAAPIARKRPTPATSKRAGKRR